MMILTFSDAYDFNQLSCGLCQLLPQFYAEPSLAEAPLGVCMHPNLKRPQFCYLGRHCFGKDPSVLLKCCFSLNAPSPNLWPSCVFWFNTKRGKPSFQVTRPDRRTWKLKRKIPSSSTLPDTPKPGFTVQHNSMQPVVKCKLVPNP